MQNNDMMKTVTIAVLANVLTALALFIGNWISDRNLVKIIHEYIVNDRSFELAKIGPDGVIAKYNEDGGDFTYKNNGWTVTTSKEYPICTLSSVSITSGTGECSLINKDGSWKIYVKLNTGCRVTCFK